MATAQRWPEVEGCLDALHAQARRVGAEILLADGNGGALPRDAATRYPAVTRLDFPGRSVLQLRALAMACARAPIIAVTEDHCRVRPDWCERILAAHAERPDAAAIGGAVENGATLALIDWASFFIANGAVMPPIGNGERRRIALQANVSYKRRVVPADIPTLGRQEWRFNQALRARGEKLVADGRIVVEHVQSLGFRGTCRIHYDDSRSIAGYRLAEIGRLERALRLAACPVMPAALIVRTLVPLVRKRRMLGRVLAATPLVALLTCCRAAGALVGFAAGPGRSPHRLR